MAVWAFCVAKWSLEDRGDGTYYVRNPALDFLDANAPRGTQARWFYPHNFTDTDGVRKPEKGFCFGFIRAPDGTDPSPLDNVAGVRLLPRQKLDDPLEDPRRQNVLDTLEADYGVPQSVFDGKVTYREHLIALARYLIPELQDL